MAKTLYEKLFDAHVVYEAENETPLLYIDRHLVHEVTSPQAFDGLRAHGRPVRQPGKTFATMDHNVSTQTKDINACGEMARIQMQELIKNCIVSKIPKEKLKKLTSRLKILQPKSIKSDKPKKIFLQKLRSQIKFKTKNHSDKNIC